MAVGLVTPAGAADSVAEARQQRDAARRKRAEIAAQLNALRASDAQLEGAVGTLNEQVRAQQAMADAARQSVQSALAAVAQAESRIAATESRMGDIRSALVGRAVSAYVRPQNDSITTVLEARDLGEASRRTALLAQVTDSDRDLIDSLRSARQDLDEEQAKAVRARDVAGQRRKAVLSRLSELQQSQAEQNRLAAALDARIREYQAEADAVARQEDGLNALIRQRAVQVPPIVRGGGGSPPPSPDGRVSGSGLIWPLRGPVTSPFGMRWGRLHAGIDIGAGSGTPIRSAKAGQVIFSGTMSGYGNTVVVDHGGGLSTLYAHQSRLGARDGQSVGQGEVIGYVGSTGRSTGPHLHFETRMNGSPQNPRRFLP
ncbi:MAG TPA: peptidoglycan DD-metalloendopeptidase family protein [Acidimicrobiales bacterium]|nr:peptidoglycan DD-metalloendopeptidase family protein [Acidimicrobiales bacterium]